MNISSPKDGFVVKLFVKDGDPVKRFAPLVQMDTDWEDRLADRVTKRQSIADARSTQYSGEQLKQLQDLAQLAVDIAKTNVDAIQRAYDINAGVNRLGGYQAALLKIDEAHLTQARMEQTRAELQQKQLNSSVTRHAQMDALAKKLSQDELDFLSARKDRLKIAAPIDGHVKLLVAEGGFAKRGTFLMEIK